MISKYYVAIRPQTNEHHAVHKEGCPFLPDYKKRIYLGAFNSDLDAVMEGQRHFNKSNSCLFCFKEHKAHREHPMLYKPANKGIILVESQKSLSYYQNMISCLN
jgi:hypothetical protein